LYIAKGFLCDDNNQEIVPMENPLSVGMKARVCVRPDATALLQDNVRIRSIDRFSWIRPDLNNVTQVAVTTNEQPEPKTEVFCQPGSEVCAFETILNDEFFGKTGIVQGKGVVWLQFGTDAASRQLQTGAEFDLGFELLPNMEKGFAGASPYDTHVVVLPPKETRELYQCRVYECEGADNKQIIPGEPKTMGASVRMCVEPSAYAIQAGANMWSVEWWDWKRKNITQPAIVKQGQEAPDGYTIQVCRRGDPVCIFQTRLWDKFFDGDGAMTGQGFCWLTYGKGRVVRGVITAGDGPEEEEKEQEEIDPSRDPLYAGSNPIAYEFPVAGGYELVISCPEPDHKLTTWWEQLDPMQRWLIWFSIVGSSLSLCCLGFCCIFSAYRDSRRETIETKAGKVTVNVDVKDTTRKERAQAIHYSQNQEYIMHNASQRSLNAEPFRGIPTERDVCFGEKKHPGTKACTQTIKSYIQKHPGVSYCPETFDDLLQNHIPSNSRFLTRDSEHECWRVATRHETISYIGEVWKRQRKLLQQ